MADLDLNGKPIVKPPKEDKEAKHTKRTEAKPIPGHTESQLGMKVEFGNIDKTKIILLQYLNMNIVELTRLLKLLVPEDKLKQYEDDARERLIKQRQG